MKNIALISAALCVAASGAIAKGHDQSNTAVPGADDVGSATVATGFLLGGILGERPDDKGPSADNPATGNAGQ